MKSAAWRWLSLAFLVGSSGAIGCGGGKGSAGPTPVASPVNNMPAVRTVLLTFEFVMPANASTFKALDLPPVGMMDATLTWAEDVPLGLFVTTNTCGSFTDLTAGRCTVIARAETSTTKPKMVRFQTEANKVYLFWVHNDSAQRATGAVEAAITTSQPIPSPTPPPASADPRLGLSPGPVTRTIAKVRTVDTGGFNYRDAYQDDQGRWVIHPGEFVVFDCTQLNANGDKCVWQNDPEYVLNDPDEVLRLRGSSNPFLLRTDVVAKGELSLYCTVDGINSRDVPLISN